ncbi:hypothetical protein [Comamonas sp. NLF-1-9]|uniref:hypothetical protein n=1 Tax=Comamonas sp. NLF-1-9 TaxID=2853163 RepID=UPI001C46A490|nr:hypothetical protein [Comamonas sp. NLF-1-9]QXL85239.1 hypothetical protein KUD94_04495 [Comamonas sp. NLF-1-9]
MENLSATQDSITRSPLAKHLEHMLHDLDPMGTCCRLNLNMEDEYKAEAPHIARLLSTGLPLRDAVCQVFDDWFETGCLQNRWGEKGLIELIAKLDQGLQRLNGAHDQMLILHEMLFENILPDLFTEESGWTYVQFMQTAPEQHHPEAAEGGPVFRADMAVYKLDDSQEKVSDDGERGAVEQTRMPSPGEPDIHHLMPWLHALLFEKTRRRTPAPHQLTYEQFLQQVRCRMGS